MATKKASTADKNESKGFAVIQTGGKQYLVREGDVLNVEKLGDLNEGDTVTFSEVLLTGSGDSLTHGSPLVSGAAVKGEVVSQGRNKKVVVMKFKAKSNYFVKNGHRQPHTRVRITSIS